MYNKIFTKILDSSIWMEPTPTRIVWLTMLAAMDEDGFVQFASIPNLAHRAILPIPETTEAVKTLESPDINSSDPDNEGRRIEKVPGGWIVLNAKKYRELVTRVVVKEQTRLRVAAHREKKKSCNANVTPRNESVTPSDTESKADSDTKEKEELRKRRSSPATSAGKMPPTDHDLFISRWSEEYPKYHSVGYKFQGGRDGAAVKSLLATRMGIGRLMEIAVKAWENPSGFRSKQASTIAGFSGSFNSIVDEVEPPKTRQLNLINDAKGESW